MFATTTTIVGEVLCVGRASVTDQRTLIFVGGNVVAVPFFFGIASDLGAFSASIGVVAIQNAGVTFGAGDACDATAKLAFGRAGSFVPMALVLAAFACLLTNMSFECTDVAVFGLGSRGVRADGRVEKGTHRALARAGTVGDGFVDEVLHERKVFFAFFVGGYVDGVEVVVGIALVVGGFVLNAVFGEFAFGRERVISRGGSRDREDAYEVFDALCSGVLEAYTVFARCKLKGDALSTLGVVDGDGCAARGRVRTVEREGVAVADFAGEAIQVCAIATDKPTFQRLIAAPVERDVPKPRRDRAYGKGGFVTLFGGLEFFVGVHAATSSGYSEGTRQQKGDDKGLSLQHRDLLKRNKVGEDRNALWEVGRKHLMICGGSLPS